ncbi:MAG TPA: hypothetical protein VGF62_08320 [Rhizomicrobium sp.]|jgi:hypothetical protein
MSKSSWTLPALRRRTLPETPLHTAAPQFPGVDFQPTHIDFNTREAEENELAIRSSLVHFKHRWPGQPAVIEGPEEFRILAWRIAEELGIRLQGPRPGSGALTRVGS